MTMLAAHRDNSPLENRKPEVSSIFLLGAAQVLVWGGSFFALAVLGPYIAVDTGWALHWIYGALSLAILISGLLAPLCGRLIVRYGGRLLLAWSGVVIALGLVILSFATSLPLFFLGWTVIGIGMAGGLMDSLFATLGNIYGVKARSALTGVTLISGFCTTLTWPVLAFGVEHVGWRSTCLAYGIVLALVIWPMYLPSLPPQATTTAARQTGVRQVLSIEPGLFWRMTAVFTLAAVLMAAMSTQMIVLLRGQGLSIVAAVGLSALLGPSQVAARIVDVVVKDLHPKWLTLCAVTMTSAGLLLIAVSPALAAAGIVLYGAGNGLRTIVRASLPLFILRADEYAVVMGRMALPAQIGQALTPLACGFLLHYLRAAVLLWTLCGLALVNVLLTIALLRRLGRLPAAH